MKRLAKRIIEHRPDHSFDKHPKCAKINYSLGDMKIDRNIDSVDKISQIMKVQRSFRQLSVKENLMKSFW